jgi:hypothetical protein
LFRKSFALILQDNSDDSNYFSNSIVLNRLPLMAKAYIEPGSLGDGTDVLERTGYLTENSESNGNTIQLRSVRFEPGRRCHALRLDRFTVRLGVFAFQMWGREAQTGSAVASENR